MEKEKFDKIADTSFKEISEWLLPSNPQHSPVQDFVASSLFQFLMTSSKFSENFPGLIKVHYPHIKTNHQCLMGTLN